MGPRSALSEGLMSLPKNSPVDVSDNNGQESNIFYGENLGEGGVMGRMLSSSVPTSSPEAYHMAGSGISSSKLFMPGSYGHGFGHIMHNRRNALERKQSFGEHVVEQQHSQQSGGLLFEDLEQYGSGSRVLSHEESKTFVRPVHDLAEPLVPRQQQDVGADSMLYSFPESPASRAVIFGLINATAGIPALIAFATIVFQHPAYSPYLDLLCKFFFASSALHQAVFNLFSTLPFAMGQVQDVGIIFMSAMATSVAELVQHEGGDVETALGSALFSMTISTIIVGLGTLTVARKSLAGFVQYIPLPVMGGYLGFVGYFCIASGVGLGSSQEISSLMSWFNIFNQDSLVKLVPTLLSCIAMVLTMEHVRHPLGLPSVLIGLVAAFHVALLVMGVSLNQAQAAGWVLAPAKGSVKFWELWKLYHFESWTLSGLYFPAIWRQGAKTLGLVLVVIFGSCMDIAAVQQDVPVRIDFNRELTTVALSNIVTGAAGVGFTGSYIFSQTIFTMRAGVFNRINGWVISIAEFLVFVYPYSIVQYIPNYFLGALMVWFGFEISRDWLFLSFYKLTLVEYILLWLTFFSVMEFGLEGGIAAGIICATLYFAYAYARSQVQNLEVGRAKSSVVRTVEHQQALALLRDTHTVTVKLQGFVFFGSASSIGTKLNTIASRLGGEEAVRMIDFEQLDLRFSQERCMGAVNAAPKFLIIDFSKVTGLDSSGARTIAGVTRELERHGIMPILSGLRRDGIASLLQAHEVNISPIVWPPDVAPIEANDGLSYQEFNVPYSPKQDEGSETLGFSAPVFLFETLEEGLRFCEDALLEVAVKFGLCTPPSAGISLQDLVNLHLNKLPLFDPKAAAKLAKEMRNYVTQQTVRRGESLWHVGDPADEMIIVERGVIRVDQFNDLRNSIWEQKSPIDSPKEEVEYQSVSDFPGFPSWLASDNEGIESSSSGAGMSRPIRSFELGPGCVGGSTDFYLARPHSTHAVCASVACRVLRISKRSMQRMAGESPMSLIVLQLAIMRLNSSDLFSAAEYANTSST